MSGEAQAAILPMSRPVPFEEAVEVERAAGEPALLVDLDGFEGPLDLLLDLARRQKVDLHRMSILALAEQYLAFVEGARRLRLEIAADYLVMAAWFAYLKSRLLLPEPPRGEEPSAGDLDTALALRLRRLEAIQEAAGRLSDRERLGRDVFARGAPEPAPAGVPRWEASLYDLLASYARQRQKQLNARVTVARREVWSLAEAREALERLLGPGDDWTRLDACLVPYLAEPAARAGVIASSFSAALEMVREGRLSVRQDGAFAPLWLRPRAPEPASAGA